ncbi:MAG: protein kinase [Candidatus Obscuribacterales bacterium]|nr:protein kinase [Candidatus Obscuribacterales bacterium]
MSELKNPEICPKCQMPLEKSGSGSLTQWILICNCGRPDATDTSGSVAPIPMCATCGKRVESGRSGTLTQWIFRADLCSCDAPQLVSPENLPAPQGATVETEASLVDQLEEMEELEVDSGSFPLQRYGPVKCLGQGVSGRVYLCIDRLLNKRVAVKVLSLRSNEQLISFQREARATSQLNHPGIVKILDFGVTDGKSPYMVLDYIDGVNLADLLERAGDLPEEDVVCLFEHICEALSYAHKRGVFHRDLKPSNIIVRLDEEGPNAWLIDFGVGSLTCETRSEQGEILCGSPAYMSPDVAGGQPFDARSEIYSFGCIFYEAFAGRPPFVGETALETLSLHAHRALPDVSFLSDKIARVILTCLQKSPRDRYQSMDAVKRALVESYSSNSELTGSFLQKEPREKPMASALVVALILVLLTTLGAIIFQNLSSSDRAISEKTAVPAPELRQALEQLEEKKWRRGLDFMGAEGWQSSPMISDEDFKALSKEKDVRHINVEVPNSITGVGFRYLVGRNVKGVRLKTPALSDEGLDALSKLKSLNGIHLSLASDMSAKGLDKLAELPHLVSLDLTVLKLPSGAFESIATIPDLRSLSFYNAKNVTLSGIEYLQKNAPRLIFLDLTGTYLDNRVIPVVAKMKNLYQVRLTNLDLNDDHLELLGNLPKLSLLYISQNKITDKGLEKLGQCRNLEVLDITRCPNITNDARRAFLKAHPKTSVVINRSDPILNSLAPLDGAPHRK